MKSTSFRLRATTTLIILLLLLLPMSQALGELLGPNNPWAAADAADIGTVPWINPDNVTTPGSPYATISFTNQPPNQTSHYLVATDYRFNIPDGATITGITVSINRHANNVPSNITDNALYLVYNDLYVGDNKAHTTTAWLDIFGIATYGGPTDLWGYTWTPAEINDPSFGVALSVNKDSNGNRSAVVDTMQITVDYSVNNTTSVDCGSGTPVTTYGSSITCVATVTATTGIGTPNGTVSWSTNDNGSFATSPCTLSGSDGTSTCSVVYTPGAVGSGSHIISAIYSGDGNFLSSSNNQVVTVNPRPISVSADPQTKVYGDTDPDLSYQVTSGSLVDGDAFSGALTRVAGEAVGTYPIEQGTLALSADYVLTYTGADLTITQRPITVTADAQSKVYGDSDPVLTYQVTSGSLVLGDDFSGALTRLTGEAVGTYPIQQGSLALSANYDLTYIGADLTITQRPVTVTADAQSKVYGDPDPALTYQVTSGSLVFGDAFSGALTRVAGEAVGTYPIEQGTLALSSNYNLTYTGANLTITQRPVTVTADAKTKVYGDPEPALTYQVTSGSLVLGDAFSGALTRPTGDSVGTYPIQQGSLALSANYDLTYIGANLTITQRQVTVTADAKTKVYGDADPALTYQVTSGSLVFGDAFSGALTRVAGEAVGTYPIEQGTLALSANYDLTYIGADLTITPVFPELTLAVTASPATFGKVGTVINFSYRLINSGDVSLDGPFTVADDLGPVSCPVVASLASGASITCNSWYTITRDDIIAGRVTSSATAAGSYGGQLVSSATATATATTYKLYQPLMMNKPAN